jgi:hypothetical protein
MEITGLWNGRMQFPPPLPGLALLFAENRWFAPASGGLESDVPPGQTLRPHSKFMTRSNASGERAGPADQR